MPIYDGLNDLDVLFDGSNELEYVYDGNEEVWANAQAIDLGLGKTWNIKELFPNIYQNLTANNFFTNGSASGFYESDSKSGYTGTDSSIVFSKSYNAETGILSASIVGRIDGAVNHNLDVHMFLVKKPSKLLSLGTSSSIDVRTRIPNWEDYTIDNFMALSIPNVSADDAYDARSYFNKSWGGGVITLNTSYWNRNAGTQGTNNNTYYFAKKVKAIN